MPRDARHVHRVRGEVIGVVAAEKKGFAPDLPHESAKGDGRKVFAKQVLLALERTTDDARLPEAPVATAYSGEVDR